MPTVSQHVLYVALDSDGSVALRNAISEPLASVHIDVCTNADEALHHLDTYHTDVVVIEYHLHQGACLALLRALSERRAAPPFVVLAANDDEAFAVNALRLGAIDCLTRRPGYEQRLAFRVQQLCTFQQVPPTPRFSASEERFRTMFAHAPVAMIVCDSEGRCLEANPAAATITGLSYSAITQRTLADLVWPPDRPIISHMQTVLSTHKMWKGRVHIFEENGDARLIDVVANGNVAPGMHVISLVYQTDWLYAEEERWMRRAQILQTEKLDALGQFISGIAHELNNPLAGIIGYAQLLREAELPDEAHADIRRIETQAQRAKHVVDNLLTFARHRTPARGWVDINDLIIRTLALREYDMQTNHIYVSTDLLPSLPQTIADGYQIQQVILSLVLNAEEALSGPNEWRNQPSEKHLKISTHVDSHAGRSNIVVSVQDNGIGIAADIQPRIFEPFFTTRSVGSGSGLGLSVAYGIVSSHNGRIWLDTENIDTLISFSLPIASESGLFSEQPPTAKPSRLRGRALVIDDEQAIAMLVQRFLEHEGMQVDLARSGKDALHMLDHAHYDVLLCDLHMSQLNGKDLYDTLLHTKPEAVQRLIFMTGDVANEASTRFLQESGCRYLAKPFELPHLLQITSAVLAEHQ